MDKGAGERPAVVASAVSLTEDVNEVMSHYFSAVKEKDEDIFRLYEDNKRLRALAQGSEHRLEELQVDLRSQHLLAASLQTEVREKQLLVEALNAEAEVLRNGVAELRVLLQRPSELDVSLTELVSEVEALLAERDILRQSVEEGQWCVSEWKRWSLWLLADEEQRGRAAIEGTAVDLHTAQWALISLAREQDDEQNGWRARYENTLDEMERQLSEQDVVLQVSQLQVQRAQRKEEEVRAERAALERQLAQCTAEFSYGSAVGSLELQFWASRTQLLLEETQDVWGILWALEGDRRRAAETHRREEVGLRQCMEEEARVHRATVGQCEQQVEQLREKVRVQKEYINESHKKLEAAAAATEEYRQKYYAHLDVVQRERNQRQGQLFALKQENLILVADNKKLSGQLEHASHAVELLTEEKSHTQRRLGAAESKVAQLEKALAERDDTLSGLETKTGELEREAERLLEALKKERAESKEQRKKLDQLSEERDELIAVHDEEVAKAKHELREWVSAAERAKSEKGELIAQLDREQNARRILEKQHQEESAMTKKVLQFSEKLMQERDSDGDVATRRSLVHQVQVLEEACRASEGVIAELRESLYLAQQQLEANSIATVAALPAPTESVTPQRGRPAFPYLQALSPARLTTGGDASLLYSSSPLMGARERGGSHRHGFEKVPSTPWTIDRSGTTPPEKEAAATATATSAAADLRYLFPYSASVKRHNPDVFPSSVASVAGFSTAAVSFNGKEN